MMKKLEGGNGRKGKGKSKKLRGIWEVEWREVWWRGSGSVIDGGGNERKSKGGREERAGAAWQGQWWFKTRDKVEDYECEWYGAMDLKIEKYSFLHSFFSDYVGRQKDEKKVEKAEGRR